MLQGDFESARACFERALDLAGGEIIAHVRLLAQIAVSHERQHHHHRALVVLDEALVDIALDLSGRPHVEWLVEMPESLPLGTPAFDPQLAEHVVSSFATSAGITLHVELVRGRNTHHIIEATFKGLARSLRDAVRVENAGGVPSTKGVL